MVWYVAFTFSFLKLSMSAKILKTFNESKPYLEIERRSNIHLLKGFRQYLF